VHFPVIDGALQEGMMSYLTQRHGGNVHERGIVAITASSILFDDPNYDVANVADLSRSRWFATRNVPNQSVVWDFREMRAFLTAYTLWTVHLKSWDLEGSIDGENWTMLDQHVNSMHFSHNDPRRISFRLAVPMECRFIRLTQTGENHWNMHELRLGGVEFFGTLSE
jgi:hypothetical protein